MNDVVVYIIAYFFIYAFLGWLCEDIYVGIGQKKFVNRGFLYGPYCPIYGFGALLVIYPLEFLKNNPLLVFIVGMLITSVLEYITGWLMEKMFHMRWWDYSKRPFNINGRVCLLNSSEFGLLTLSVIYIIHPFITEYLLKIPFRILTLIIIIALSGFIVDLIYTLIALIKRKKLYEKAREQAVLLRERFEQEKRDKFNKIEERFNIWLNSQPEYDYLNELRERLDKMQKEHIAKAFPQRKSAKAYSSALEMLKELKNNLNETLKDLKN